MTTRDKIVEVLREFDEVRNVGTIADVIVYALNSSVPPHPPVRWELLVPGSQLDMTPDRWIIVDAAEAERFRSQGRIVRPLYAEIPNPQATHWQPIATAPQDFTQILVGWWHHPDPSEPEQPVDKYGGQAIDPAIDLTKPRWVWCKSSYLDYGHRRGFPHRNGARQATHWMPVQNPTPGSSLGGEIWYRWRGPRGGWIFDTNKPTWPCDTIEVRVAGTRDWGIPDSRIAYQQANGSKEASDV